MKISNQDFRDQEIDLDFHEFEQCKFANCVLIIHGFGGVSLSNCDFVRCKWVVADAALKTITILSLMYNGGMNKIVEGFISGIRTGNFPVHQPPGATPPPETPPQEG